MTVFFTVYMYLGNKPIFLLKILYNICTLYLGNATAYLFLIQIQIQILIVHFKQ